MRSSDADPVYSRSFMYVDISDIDGRGNLIMRQEIYQWMKDLAFFHACFCCCRKKSGTSGGIPEKLQPGRTGADGSGSAGDPGNLSEGSLRK